jgi:phospholipid-translocating ATPase
MEMKKLHMGTMSFGSDTMDEVVHQLNTAFGATDSMLILSNLQFYSSV